MFFVKREGNSIGTRQCARPAWVARTTRLLTASHRRYGGRAARDCHSIALMKSFDSVERVAASDIELKNETSGTRCAPLAQQVHISGLRKKVDKRANDRFRIIFGRNMTGRGDAHERGVRYLGHEALGVLD